LADTALLPNLPHPITLTMSTHFHVDPNIAKAKTINTNIYTSTEVFELCKEKIFADTWQFIGSEELVNDTGYVHPFALLLNYLNEPLILTKDKQVRSTCYQTFVHIVVI